MLTVSIIGIIVVLIMKVVIKKKYGQMIELTDLLFNIDVYVAIMFGNNN